MKIDTVRLKGRLRDYVERLTERGRSRDEFICPLCHSGEGAHKTPAFRLYEKGYKWKCFSCGNGGDIFDLVRLIDGADSLPEQAKSICKTLGEHFDGYQNETGSKPKEQASMSQEAPQKASKEKVSYASFIAQCANRIEETDYHRGISLETLKRFNVGYCPNWRHPNTKNDLTSPRLIIPSSEFSYLARAINDKTPCPKLTVGGKHTFNLEAVTQTEEPIFIVEGELDALSLIDSGAQALAICGLSRAKNFIAELKDLGQKVKARSFIIALDNDPEGSTAREDASKQAELLECGLKGLGLSCTRFSFAEYFPAKADDEGAYIKDANDALRYRPEVLKEAIQEVTSGALESAIEEARKEEEDFNRKKEAYLGHSASAVMLQLHDELMAGAGADPIPTGFPQLDALLEGGLYPRFHVLGAAPSQGKTSLAVQIADNVAKTGKDVLIFTLELTTKDLVTRSMSRISYELLERKSQAEDYAWKIADLQSKKRFKLKYGTPGNQSDTQEKASELLGKTMIEYGKFGKHLRIVEGFGDVSIGAIEAAIQEHQRYTGQTPLVIVDYLQCMAQENERGTDKQNIDANIKGLVRITRDYKTPVLCLSSFNRGAYKEGAEQTAFKETGLIESSADVLLGLELAVISRSGTQATAKDIEEAESKDVRELTLKVLKNRMGAMRGRVAFKYVPSYFYFTEAVAL